MDTFQDDIDRGYLENGEPLEAQWGVGWWSESQTGDFPPVTQCHICNGSAYDLGDYESMIDCENCGKISYDNTNRNMEK